jgi:hypothetical protein
VQFGPDLPPRGAVSVEARPAATQFRPCCFARRETVNAQCRPACRAVSCGPINIPIIRRAYKCSKFEYAVIRQWIVVLLVASHATVLTVPYVAIYASASDVPGVFLRVCLLNAMTSATPAQEKVSNREFERPQIGLSRSTRSRLRIMLATCSFSWTKTKTLFCVLWRMP